MSADSDAGRGRSSPPPSRSAWRGTSTTASCREEIPAAAKPLLSLVVAIFLCALLLATAGNEQIVYPFFAMHAL